MPDNSLGAVRRASSTSRGTVRESVSLNVLSNGMTSHRRKKPWVASSDLGAELAEKTRREYGRNSKLALNLCSPMIVSPPVRALNIEVLDNATVGKSGQILASLPTSRAAANLSDSILCRL